VNPEDLEVMIGKRVRGVSYEEANGIAYFMIITSGGRTFQFTSPAPIDLELETEN
jgi:hypothetical protein